MSLFSAMVRVPLIILSSPPLAFIWPFWVKSAKLNIPDTSEICPSITSPLFTDNVPPFMLIKVSLLVSLNITPASIMLFAARFNVPFNKLILPLVPTSVPLLTILSMFNVDDSLVTVILPSHSSLLSNVICPLSFI